MEIVNKKKKKKEKAQLDCNNFNSQFEHENEFHLMVQNDLHRNNRPLNDSTFYIRIEWSNLLQRNPILEKPNSHINLHQTFLGNLKLQQDGLRRSLPRWLDNL